MTTSVPNYLVGAVIGAATIAPSQSRRALVIRLNDVRGLLQAQSGIAAAAHTLLPDALESVVFGKMKEEIDKELVKMKVNATTSIVDAAPGTPMTSAFLKQFGLGVVTGVVAGLVVRAFWPHASHLGVSS